MSKRDQQFVVWLVMVGFALYQLGSLLETCHWRRYF